MKHLRRLTLVIVSTTACLLNAQANEQADKQEGVERVAIPDRLPPHPRLFLNTKEIDSLKQWVDREPWLQKYVRDFLTSTRKRLDDIPLPSAKGGMGSNGAIARLANEFALAYVLADEKVFADAAARILLAYVPLYIEYPVTATKGRAQSSTLDEAQWAGDYACAYDLIYQSGALSADDCQAIEKRVLKPCGEVLRICNHHTRSNWRARAIAGVAMVGFCIDDRELIDEALNGYRDQSGFLVRYGFVHHVARSVMADGIFYERSFGYQAYTTDSYFLLMEAARHSGIDLWNLKVKPHFLDAGADVERKFGPTGAKTIRSVFDSLFYRTFSDGTVPVVANASEEMFVSRRCYEAAWRAYRDPKFAFAARISGGAKRPWADPQLSDKARLRSPTDLFWLQPDLPEGRFDLAEDATIGHTGQHINGCTLLPNGGYTVLRQQPQPDSVGVSMTFGRWGSGHSHPDKLSIVVSDGQRKALREVKYFRYGSSEHLQWDLQTITHNTVTVDEKSQAPQSDGDFQWPVPPPGEMVRGRPLLFHPGDRLKVFRADCTDAYDGVRLERTVALVDSVIVDFYRCQSDARHTYDYALHVDGEFSSGASADPGPLSDSYGYRYITQLCRQRVSIDNPTTLNFSPRGHMAILSNGDVTTGLGIKGTKGEQRSVMVLRQEGESIDFVTVISFGEQAAVARRVDTGTSGELAVRLNDQLIITSTPRAVVLAHADGQLIESTALTLTAGKRVDGASRR